MSFLQWSSINSNGNWYKKEQYVRALAETQDVKITIGRMGGVIQVHLKVSV